MGVKLNNALAAIDKKFGQGSVITLGDKKVQKFDTYTTGSLTTDLATGVGGFPKGRITEIYGEESTGKTTLTIHAMAHCQEQKGTVAFIDVEHAFDKAYASALGVDINKLKFSQPDSAEQALGIAEMLIDSGEIDLLIIDSVAALVPQAEIDGEMGDSHMGLQARLMGQALRKLTPKISKNNTAVIFINQTREKIGVIFGSPLTTSGGNALKFYASIRLQISRDGQPIKDKKGDIISRPTRVKVVKNKLAPPFKVGKFDIEFGLGINRMGELVDLAVDLELMDKSGSWYSYGGIKIGQGKLNVVDFLYDNEEVTDKIEDGIFKLLK